MPVYSTRGSVDVPGVSTACARAETPGWAPLASGRAATGARSGDMHRARDQHCSGEVIRVSQSIRQRDRATVGMTNDQRSFDTEFAQALADDPGVRVDGEGLILRSRAVAVAGTIEGQGVVLLRHAVEYGDGVVAQGAVAAVDQDDGLADSLAHEVLRETIYGHELPDSGDFCLYLVNLPDSVRAQQVKDRARDTQDGKPGL